MDSKDDTLWMGKTDSDGDLVLLPADAANDKPRLWIGDNRGRHIATISDLGALFDALDGLEI